MCIRSASISVCATTWTQRLTARLPRALIPLTGLQLWRLAAGSGDVHGTNALLALGNGTVYMQAGPSAVAVMPANQWRLEGVDAESGHVRWTAPLRWLLGNALLTESAMYGYSDGTLPGHL